MKTYNQYQNNPDNSGRRPDPSKIDPTKQDERDNDPTRVKPHVVEPDKNDPTIPSTPGKPQPLPEPGSKKDSRTNVKGF
jgi:hypothetical protein